MSKRIKISSDQRPFVITYWDFIESDLFDWNEKRIFIILKKFADNNNKCFPSIKTLCRLSQLSKNTVKKALKNLEGKKAIKIEHRKNDEINKNQSNLYTLYDYAELWNAADIETIKETIDIEELRLFELAKKKGYTLTKENELTSHADQSNDASPKNNPILSSHNNTTGKKQSQDLERYTLGQIKQLFDYDILIHDNPFQKQDIDTVMDILHTAMNTNKPIIRIAGQDMPCMAVIGKLMKLDKESIMYAIGKFAEQTERVKNPAAYMLTVLYNAPEQHHLDTLNRVSYDMAHEN